MEAIVLAGGLGTRLRGVVDDVPKPMAPVQGRPFLAFVLDQLVDTAFHTAILAVGYRHEVLGNNCASMIWQIACPMAMWPSWMRGVESDGTRSR